MANRLATASSPYLRQHAGNPVDWFPWGPDALAEAKRRDVPILLSVGYAACHWCHVMERESFEDAAIAAKMNADFVNIKVDREERPDVDDVSMRAVMAVQQGRGGWPSTVFLLPDGRPFWGGTYFPPTPRHGMPSFPSILARMSSLWRDQRADVVRAAESLTEHIVRAEQPPAPVKGSTDRWLAAVVAAWAVDFDEENGGFVGRPKFPPHGGLPVLWTAALAGDARAAAMAERTLEGMMRGGTYDLLAGGFCRYSVDEHWVVPHFEKMLYDQAELIPSYVLGHQALGRPEWARVARETAAFVLRELGLPDGGFAASLDADAAGEEGSHASWTPEEIVDVLGPTGVGVAATFGVTAEGNFEHGRSVLRLERPLEDQSNPGALTAAMLRLADARARRPQPTRDDKMVAAWNGRMGSALVGLFLGLGDRWALDAALDLAAAIDRRLVVGGRLHRSALGDSVSVPAFCDDVAAVGLFHLDLFQATGSVTWLDRAVASADFLISEFWSDSCLAMAARDAEPLAARPSSLLSQAEPGGNGLGALLFARLATLTGRADFGERADGILAVLQNFLRRNCRSFGVEALAGAVRASGGRLLVVTGPGAVELAQAVATVPDTLRVMAALERPDVARVPASEHREAAVATAFVCEADRCSAPETDRVAAQKVLVQAAKGRGSATLGWPPAPAGGWLGSVSAPWPGRVTVLHAWAPDVAESDAMAHQLDDWFNGEAQPAVQVVAVAVGDTSVARRERAGLRHPVLLAAGDDVAAALDLRTWPTVIVLDAAGAEVARWSGRFDLAALDRVVAALPRRARGPSAGAVLPPIGSFGPTHLCLGDDGVLHFSDTGRHAIVEGVVEPAADGWPHVRVLRSWGGDAGYRDGAQPRFRRPHGVLRVGDDLWVADTGNDAVRRIDLRTGEAATASQVAGPVAMAGDAHAVFVSSARGRTILTHVAGSGRWGELLGDGVAEHVDGPLHAARAVQPMGLALAGGLLWFTDGRTGRVRVVDLDAGEVATAVGEVAFAGPDALAVDGDEVVVAERTAGALTALDPTTGRRRALATGLAGPVGLARWGRWWIVVLSDGDGLVAVADDGNVRPVTVA